MPTFSSAIFPPSEFWDYAIILYSHEEVAAACLRLQDRRGVDVNMLLFCIWVAASGRERLSAEELAAALTASSLWQGEVVHPLRHARRYLKAPEMPVDGRLAGELRRVVADSELFAEHVQMLMLERIMARPGSGSFGVVERGAAAATNLENYFRAAGLPMAAADQQDLRIIRAVAFPGGDMDSPPFSA